MRTDDEATHASDAGLSGIRYPTSKPGRTAVFFVFKTKKTLLLLLVPTLTTVICIYYLFISTCMRRTHANDGLMVPTDRPGLH